ncbi:MAG: aromatic-ring-hydroxylating dioxygenase subunit beta [Paraburkholderia tropica]|uniref:Benzoate/toluate 1,2-dioxygenase beta subunit/2,4,5-trichlorophenoxyacetic acid oxygenase 2 n=1 Tax=Paraburkholderia tropica TaxID=92647 RepID=A0ABX5MJ00_9BURK|nr:aromatic-ring-hydroxylating dioxygenase subunit beta [Paraburkholderia tropica]PXX12527.1 benzoate/toluate 1,2-dioxygenase beta subunit/2,4,5-trichlorophenoxyacetic acid oxygenase 2 [Paraburkholderia tropica]PZW76504.1 benzoate/toluate 1,2-dioxygenase beta subunit/2,4,5-trichlorophenoxyacetic acid oxygenase 2 [Paraburkholderia tropica]
MNPIESQHIAARVLALEGFYLDQQNWDAWLSLYAPDCEYWVPAWRNEHELVSDVRCEVSLIYHPTRSGLEERVVRLRSRKSVTAMPLPRTVHQTGNVLVDEVTSSTLSGTASWTVHEYDPRVSKLLCHSGRYEYSLMAAEDGWVIARKKIVLLNDVIPTVIDFYNL